MARCHRSDSPDSVGDVRFYVPPYMVGPRVAEVLAQMGSLEVVQTLTAGVDNVRAQVPEGVTLCNGRGIHDTSTAELALTLILVTGARLYAAAGVDDASRYEHWCARCHGVHGDGRGPAAVA